jgi:hypothetical protein
MTKNLFKMAPKWPFFDPFHIEKLRNSLLHSISYTGMTAEQK